MKDTQRKECDMVPIIIEKKDENWVAYIVTTEKEGTYEIGVGKTYKEAVGDLVLKNLVSFNISIGAIKR